MEISWLEIEKISSKTNLYSIYYQLVLLSTQIYVLIFE